MAKKTAYQYSGVVIRLTRKTRRAEKGVVDVAVSSQSSPQVLAVVTVVVEEG